MLEPATRVTLLVLASLGLCSELSGRKRAVDKSEGLGAVVHVAEQVAGNLQPHLRSLQWRAADCKNDLKGLTCIKKK